MNPTQYEIHGTICRVVVLRQYNRKISPVGGNDTLLSASAVHLLPSGDFVALERKIRLVIPSKARDFDMQQAAERPESFAIRERDLRRVNLHRFPYHFLFRGAASRSAVPLACKTSAPTISRLRFSHQQISAVTQRDSLPSASASGSVFDSCVSFATKIHRGIARVIRSRLWLFVLGLIYRGSPRVKVEP